jgi:hypothetical protein
MGLLKKLLFLNISQVKSVQGQLVAIINIVAVVGGAFLFGYKAVEYSLNEPDITKVDSNGLFFDT